MTEDEDNGSPWSGIHLAAYAGMLRCGALQGQLQDEALVAIEIARVLTGAGFDVAGPARSVPAALDLLRKSGCSAAVPDINLGRETSEAIAVELTASGTPFVTLSGYSLEQHQFPFAGAPALTKPLRAEFLIAALRNSIEHKEFEPAQLAGLTAQ
jgi:DNA-binding NarL/FixJ family response regulator